MGIGKVIILSGGRATRLPNSARDIPKSLVEIGGKAILEHQLERLHQAGFSDVRLALGFRAEQIIEFLRKSGYNCDYVVESEPLGTGGAVKFVSSDLKEPFMVLNGDTFADFDFRSIAGSHQPATSLIVSHWKDDARDFGLLELENDFIKSFLEKPKEPIGGHINAGCYIFNPHDFIGTPDGFFMLEEIIFPRLAQSGLLRTYIHKGFWEDLGTEERLAGIRARSDFFLT